MSRLLFRRLAPLVLMTAVVLLSGCSAATVSGTSATPNATVAPLAESLLFHGDISGTLTTGIDAHSITHDNPIPAYTQQSDGTFFDPPPRST
jgi:hypothetical protein